MGWRKDTLGRWRYSYRCDTCNRSLGKVGAAPMLRDNVWLQIADSCELPCAPCARQRAKYHLGHDLTVADLKPCVFNSFRDPPWNDVLAPGNMTPEIEAEWDAMIDKAIRDERERQAALTIKVKGEWGAERQAAFDGDGEAP